MPAKPEQSPLMDAVLDVLNYGYSVAHAADAHGFAWAT